MKKTYLKDELIFSCRKEVNEWIGQRVRLMLINKEEPLEGIVEKYLYDDDSHRTVIPPQFQPVGLRISGLQINFNNIMKMEILDI